MGRARRHDVRRYLVSGGGGGGGGSGKASTVYGTSAAPDSDTDGLFNSIALATDGWMTIGLTRGSSGQAPHEGIQWDLGALVDMDGTPLSSLGRGGTILARVEYRNRANSGGLRVGCYFTNQSVLPSSGGVQYGIGGRILDNGTTYPVATQVLNNLGVLAFSGDKDDGDVSFGTFANGYSNMRTIVGVTTESDLSVLTGGDAQYTTDILSGHLVDKVILGIAQVGSSDSGSNRTVECRITVGVHTPADF